MIKIDLIEDIASSINSIDDKEFLRDILIVLDAVNDWDKSFETLEEFEVDWEVFLGGSLQLSCAEIKAILQSKSPRSEAWKIESISSLVNLLELNDLGELRLLTDVLNEIKGKVFLQAEGHGNNAV